VTATRAVAVPASTETVARYRPVLGRHGPVGVSVHTTWIAAVIAGLALGNRNGEG
jgi:hypothetical protein